MAAGAGHFDGRHRPRPCGQALALTFEGNSHRLVAMVTREIQADVQLHHDRDLPLGLNGRRTTVHAMVCTRTSPCAWKNAPQGWEQHGPESWAGASVRLFPK